MNFHEDACKVLYDVQKKCNELNQKIDSIIHIMEIFSTYMQYTSMMNDFDLNTFQKMTGGGNEDMNPRDFQKILSAAKKNSGGQQMSQDEFDTIFETLKQGKSEEEIARMEQMVQLAKSFMK